MTKNLSDWEEYLEPFFSQITLLGEIPLTYNQVEEIGQGIRGLIQRNKLSKVTEMLDGLYYRTFAVYLVHIAAHNTEREYWGVVEANLGVARHTPTNQGWKLNFIKTLKEFELPTFDNAGGYRYVTPIRLHAGIPAYSLHDFFEHILLPSVQKKHLAELPTIELIDEILKHSSVQTLVDSPVRYFLEYGRKNAPEYVLRFMENCQKMARFYLKNYDLPSPAELNLPPYVMRVFRRFMENGQDSKTGARMRYPYITLNPWGPEFYLHLPQQPVEGIHATKPHYWEIEGYGAAEKAFARTERVHVRQRGHRLETRESQIPLDAPINYLQISFCRQNPADDIETLFARRLHLLPTPDQPPLLAFHTHNGRQMRWSQTIPANEFWLFYPKSAKLQAENARHIQEFPEFYGNWADWQIGWWDFSQASLIRLIEAENENPVALIPIQKQSPEPELVGGVILPQIADPDDVPFYIGEPPRLHIPLRLGRTLAQELSRWHIELNSPWAAAPALDNQSYSLEDFADQVEFKENVFELPLSVLLGNQPAGSYRGVVRGPIGSCTPIRFRIWPELEIEGLAPYYLPGRDGANEAQFTITVPEGCQVQPQAGMEGVTVMPTGQQFAVTVGSDLSLAELSLVMPRPTQPLVRISLSLAIPRLRWAFPQGIREREMVWHTSPISRSVDAILQATQVGDTAALYIQLPTTETLLFALHLVNPEDGSTHQESRQTHESHRLRTRWRFPLGEFSDTLRNLPDLPTLEFHLVILDEYTNKIAKVPLLRLNRTLDIHYVWMEYLASPTFRLFWEEPHPLRNRRVRIWSEWQPWILPIEIKIPNDARGELLVTDIGLPPSHYRFHFFTAAPWEQKEKPLNPPEDSFLVDMITPKNKLKWLKSQLEEYPDREFLLRFERACIYASCNEISRCNEEIKWCYRNLDKATPKQIVALHRWVGQIDESTQRAIRIYMYRYENLARLFEMYPSPDPTRAAYLHYFPHMNIIKLNSVQFLLEHQIDVTLVLRCLRFLLEQENELCIIEICKRVESGQLSDADAQSLMARKANFSLETLSHLSATPTRTRLLANLAKSIPDQQIFITPGYWVLTDAGWGKIDKIQYQNTKIQINHFNPQTDTPNLYITLRPNTPPEEQILLKLADEEITFLNEEEIYICIYSDCKFATTDRHLLSNKHNRFSHKGVSPRFRTPRHSPNKIVNCKKPTCYSVGPPENECLGN